MSSGSLRICLIDFEPAWSPDGRRIVVARGPSTTPPPDQLTQPTDLWIIDLVSGRERQLTNSPNTWEGWPHWSPDGRRIAFEGDPVEPGNKRCLHDQSGRWRARAAHHSAGI